MGGGGLRLTLKSEFNLFYLVLKSHLDIGSRGYLGLGCGDRGDWRGLLISCWGDFTWEIIVYDFFLTFEVII